MTPRISLALTSAVVLTFVLAACSSAPEAVELPQPSVSAPAPVATTDPVPSEEPEAPAADPTCETIISAGTLQNFEELGWTFEANEFEIGSHPIPGGIWCAWADYSQPSDHGQLYAWGPMEPADAAAAQAELIAQGWLRESGPDGVYITEDPDVAFQTDEDGYGMTYLFGDGWVTFADTKQSLLLIDWP